jgi:hypothetical protein
MEAVQHLVCAKLSQVEYVLHLVPVLNREVKMKILVTVFLLVGFNGVGWANSSNLTTGSLVVVKSSTGGGGFQNSPQLQNLSVSGILKSNSSGTPSAAVSGTDYAPATSGSSILYGNGSGGFSNVTIGSNLTFTGGTLAASGGGGGSPGGSSGQLQYNNSGSFGGLSNFIVSSGNYGIGSANPGQILDINGTARMVQLIATGSGNSTLNLNGGNVGIGSANPAQKLDITGTAQMTGFSLPTNASSGYVLTSNSVGIGTWAVASGGGSTPGGSSGQFQYNNSGSLAGASNLTIGSGNIGVGSTNPSQILDVNGPARVTSLTATANVPSVFYTNVGIGSTNPGQVLDVQGTLMNIRSPNGTVYKCGPANGGTWGCT